MSRTKRRTDRKAPIWIMSDWIRFDQGNGWIRVPLEGKELAKSLHCWHGDKWNVNNPSKWFRKNGQSRHRSTVKSELSKYYKDEDYEIQISSKVEKDYWD